MQRALLLVLLSLFSLQVGAARADWESDMKAWQEIRQRNREAEKANPEQAVTTYRTFLEGRQDMNPAVGVEVVSVMVDLCYTRLKKTDMALQLCDWALETYRNDRYMTRTVTDKAKILVGEKRHAEAQELVEKHWDVAMAAYREHIGQALLQYVAALDAQGKRAEATQAVRKVLLSNGDVLDDWVQGPPPGWMYDRVARDLIAKNQMDEALRWGKLYFVACGPSKWSCERAGLFLQRIWKLKEMSDRTYAAFTEAVADPAKPNPLAGVKLPDMDREALSARVERTELSISDRMGVINALIAGGRMREALLKAGEWYTRRPDDFNADAVLRVLKAGTEAGKHVLFTTDGCADVFAERLFECGVRGIRTEPYTDFKATARRHPDAFLCGEGDVRILLRNDPSEIRRMVQSMVETGRTCGGYFLSIGNLIPHNVPAEALWLYLDLCEELGWR